MPVKDILAYDVDLIDDEDTVSPKMVRELYKFCQGFFNSFLKGELKLLATLPMTGVKCPSTSKRYSNFSDAQIVNIIDVVSKEEDWKKWAVLLAIYTGARRGDITNLTRDSLKYDDKTKRPYFWIREGKTEAAQRAIPISKTLEELGIVEFINRTEGDIFPKLKANRNLLTDYFKSLIVTIKGIK